MMTCKMYHHVLWLLPTMSIVLSCIMTSLKGRRNSGYQADCCAKDVSCATLLLCRYFNC
uniref:Uncharacterized protein n=1 Tax=Arundo donax TaxID=35708 RepID=A0A0A9HQ44_ARUDO